MVRSIPESNDMSSHQEPHLASGHSRAGTTIYQRPRLPSDYAKTVSNHSTRSEHDSLYPGAHYRSIAKFLSSPSYSLEGQNRPQNPDFVKREHEYAILHDLAYERQDQRYLTAFSRPEDFSAHQAPHNNCGQLLFLRGYPTQEWINTIGARYRVDPEVFRRQLQHGPKCEHFDLPDLPSSSFNIIKLSTTTIGHRHVFSGSREEEQNRLEKHFHSLGKRGILGESIVRQVWSHDELHFSIEQNIVINVVSREEGWLALILLDHGRDLDEGPEGPWLDLLGHLGKFDTVFQPVIQFEPRMWSMKKESNPSGIAITSLQGESVHRPYAQSAALLASHQYGQFLSLPLMRLDPFYALHDLFVFCSSAENQFLNALRHKVKPSFSHSNDEKALQASLENLGYHKHLLRMKIEQLEDVVQCIRSRGDQTWQSWQPLRQPPVRRKLARSSTGSSPKDKETLIQDSLHDEARTASDRIIQDYEALLRRAKALSCLYNEDIEDIRTSAALLEAKKSVEQAESIGRLSWLAFLFLPMSLTAALFGMNFREIGTNLSIWIYPALSIPVFLITVLIYFWPEASASVRKTWSRCQPGRLFRSSYRPQRSKPGFCDKAEANGV